MKLWESLPPELRSMILDIVVENYSSRSEPGARAGYASVCREWQRVFEPINFQRLVVDQDRVWDLAFYTVTRQRRDYVQHLFLRLRLDEYGCTVCQSKEGEITVRNNDRIFTRAIFNLLFILSEWTGSNNARRQHGLTLELGAYSPSDYKHIFRDFHFEDGNPYPAKIDLETQFGIHNPQADSLPLDKLHDPDHGCVYGRRESLSVGTKQRIIGTLTYRSNLHEFPNFSKTFLKVDIVTGLLIRRQFYRKIAATSLGELLRESLTSLQTFRHEEWHNVDQKKQSDHEKCYKTLLSSSLPSTLRNLFIFEDSNEILHPERYASYTEPPAAANPALGKALSKSSRTLENLSAAFLVDAKDFLSAFFPTRKLASPVVPWTNLRTLALTSALLHLKNDRFRINELLMAAARAAAFMPKLEIMEIWNGSKGRICVFRYERIGEKGNPQITWASNWGSHVFLYDPVIRCWEVNLAGQTQHLGALTSLVVLIPREKAQVKSFAAAIPFLKLRENVWDSSSAYQLQLEERARSENHCKSVEANV